MLPSTPVTSSIRTGSSSTERECRGAMSTATPPPLVEWSPWRGRPGRLGGLVALVSVLLATLPASVDGKPACPPEHFHIRGRCYPCSACPGYLIVRRPCAPESDTLCGPLYDFEFLRGQPDDEEDESGDRRRRTKVHVQPPPPPLVPDDIDSSSSSSTSSNAVDVHAGSFRHITSH